MSLKKRELDEIIRSDESLEMSIFYITGQRSVAAGNRPDAIMV